MLVICTAVIIKDRFLKDVTTFDKIYTNEDNDIEKIKFFLETPPTDNEEKVSLSVVFPIKNDEQNLPIILEDLVSTLQKKKNRDPNFSWEIIIVNNCSTDNSSNIILGYSHTTDSIRLIRLESELGQSAALQIGAINSRGNIILLTDLQTLSLNVDKIDNFDIIETKLNGGSGNNNQSKQQMAIICGIRNQLQKGSENSIPMWNNNFYAMFKTFSGCTKINSAIDPLCPFVFMTHSASKIIIPNMHINNFCGFAEIISIAQQKNININEMDINYNQKIIQPMSFDDFLVAFGEILKLSICYQLHIWKIKSKRVSSLSPIYPKI